MGYETLIYAIFRQCFEDYNLLIESGKTFSTSHTTLSQSKHHPEQAYSISEIQRFLRSGWCDTLLSAINKDEDRKMRQMINTALDAKEPVSMDFVIEYQDKSQTLSEWADEYGIKRDTLYRRLAVWEWNFNKALTTPV